MIASIGVPEAGYKEQDYALGGKSARSRFAPAALARLLDLKGWEAAILVTPKARNSHFRSLTEELTGLGLAVRDVETSESLAPEDIESILDKLDNFVDVGCRVVLDVTYGLRHLPMIYLVSLAYLVPVKRVQVDGIYYGAREAGGAFVDLSSLLEIIRWAHAVEAAREIGDLRLIAARLTEAVRRNARIQRVDPAASAAQKQALRLSKCLSSGLPVEIGLAAQRLASDIGNLSSQTAPNLVLRALQLIEPMLAGWGIANSCWKDEVRLNEGELRRELRLVQWWIEKEDLPKALSALREWMVNFIVQIAGKGAEWLNYAAARKPAEDTLNAWAEEAKRKLGEDSPPAIGPVPAVGFARATEGTTAESRREIGSLWSRISIHRNRLMHAGFSLDEADKVSPEKVRQLHDRCSRLLEMASPSPSENATAGSNPNELAPCVFANLSNHSSAGWDPRQRDAALALAGEIVDVSLPAVPPDWDLENVRELAFRIVQNLPPRVTHAMVMGEFTLTACLVEILQKRGIQCLAATTERDVRSTPQGEKVSAFRFVRFREYPAFE